MGNYEFDARGLAFWAETETKEISVFGNTYKIPFLRLRPDFMERDNMVNVKEQTVEIIYDKDER